MLLVAGLLSAGGVAETVPVEPQQIQEPVAEESAAPTEAPAPAETTETTETRPADTGTQPQTET